MAENKLNLTGRELKLGIATLLAIFYIAVWPNLRPLRGEPEPTPPRVSVGALPRALQPEVRMPDGSVHADSAAVRAREPQRISRARPRRIRTRSS